MNPLSLAGLGIGLIGSIGKMFGRKKANRKMDALLAEDPAYKANPLAANRLGLTQTLLNARNPGAQQVQNNIFATQASNLDNINKNATDSSQALALASGATEQTNQAFNQQGINEANDYQTKLQNLFNAQNGQINEDDKVYNDSVRRYGDKFQVKGAQNENSQNTWGDISNAGFGLADFGMAGGFGKMFGGGRKRSTPSFGGMAASGGGF